MMEKTIQAEFRIEGLVQGVGFRYFVYRYAQKHGLSGFVKNEYDGSVFVLVEGEESKINELHRILKIGPSHSYVEAVKVKYSDYTGKYTHFDIVFS